MALFLFTTLAFILVAMLSRGGWTMGHVLTTSIIMPVTVPCPPNLGLGGTTTCTLSELVVLNSRVNYGK